MKTCIDLRPICRKHRWRWRFEESFQAEQMRSTHSEASWFVEIICRNGFIYPAGGDDLLVAIEDHLKILPRLRTIGPQIRPHQGKSVLRFPVQLLSQVVEILKPKHIPGRFATTGDRRRLARNAIRQGNRNAKSTLRTSDQWRHTSCHFGNSSAD